MAVGPIPHSCNMLPNLLRTWIQTRSRDTNIGRLLKFRSASTLAYLQASIIATLSSTRSRPARELCHETSWTRLLCHQASRTRPRPTPSCRLMTLAAGHPFAQPLIARLCLIF